MAGSKPKPCEYMPQTKRGLDLHRDLTYMAGPDAQRQLMRMTAAHASWFDLVAEHVHEWSIDDGFDVIEEDDGSESVMYCVEFYMARIPWAVHAADVALTVGNLTPDAFQVERIDHPTIPHGIAFKVWCDYTTPPTTTT